MPADIVRAPVLTVAFALALLVSPLAGGVAGGVAPVAAAVAIATLSLASGGAIRRMLGVPRDVPYATSVELVTGFAGVSVVHLAATAGLNIGAIPAFAADLTAVAALRLATVRVTEPEPAPATSAGMSRLRSLALDVTVVLACAALASYWARETVLSVAHVRTTGVFNAWWDYLLHASEVTYLKDYPAFGARSQYLTGIPQPLYHRASYALAALFSAISGIPSLETATTFWMPTGLVLCMLAIYGLGCALGGPLSGLAAVGTIFLLPDASTYGFHNRFLSFHWVMHIVAGSGYAVALTLVALIRIVTAERGRQARAYGGAAVLVAAGGLFRVHIGILACGMVAGMALWTWRPTFSIRRLTVILVSVSALTAFVLWMESVELAPHFLSHRARPIAFFQMVHQQNAWLPTPYTGWTAGHGDLWAFVVGYAMFLAAGYGIMVAGLIVAWVTGSVAGLGWQVKTIPLALLVAQIGVIVGVPTPAHGDVTDFAHRPFVLVYIVLGTIAGAALANRLRSWSFKTYGTSRVAWLIVLGLCLVGGWVPWRIGADVQQQWNPRYGAIPISAEVWSAGRFVRTHSAPGEQVIAASEDGMAVVVALTERAAFLSRSRLYRLLSPETSRVVEERAAQHAALGGNPSFGDLQSFGGRTGVAWYVADTPETQQWSPATRSRCAFCGDMVQVYDLR